MPKSWTIAIHPRASVLSAMAGATKPRGCRISALLGDNRPRPRRPRPHSAWQGLGSIGPFVHVTKLCLDAEDLRGYFADTIGEKQRSGREAAVQ